MSFYLLISSFSALWTGVFLVPAKAASIAAWYTGQGAPQVIMQDDTTGQVLYSLCNSNDTTVFPANASASFTFDSSMAPKNGTSLAGVGYPQNGYNMAAMWYLNSAGNIVEALWRCNENGYFEPAGSTNQWIVSSSAPSIHPNTGLAVVNLGEQPGYRVYYQQEDLTTSTLKYTREMGWVWNGNVSQDSRKGFPISSGFTDISEITVVTPRDESNIEVSTLQPNESWVISTFPTPLRDVDRQEDQIKMNLAPTNGTDSSSFSLATNTSSIGYLDAWDGKAASIGFTLDSDAKRRVFYIGNDSKIHCQAENSRWSTCSDVGTAAWPTADNPNAQFATAFDFSRNQIWIFYMSDGNLTQVHRSSKDKWDVPIALPSTPPPPPLPTEPEYSGLSKGAQAGIGVGVSVVGLALIAFGVYVIIQRKRGKQEKERADAEAEVAAASANKPPDTYSSPAPAYTSGVPTGQWIDGQWMLTPEPGNKPGPWQDRSSYQAVPNSPPMFEMSNEASHHEMAAESSSAGIGK
ncbi:hypothetical protein F5Y19DRAFT_489890 [Xylariaceae sp. FL1651]|nr:hypothetical protein F5Y19DRAFT_489890 [Xylariaceae sp. FL1651]